MNIITVYLKEITGQDEHGQDTYGSSTTDLRIGYTEKGVSGESLEKDDTYTGTNIMTLLTNQSTAIKYQVFLDSACTQKAGFIISISAKDGYNRQTFMLYSPVNGAYYCLPIPINNTDPIYMIFSIFGNVTSQNAKIKEIAEQIVTSWKNPTSYTRTRNLEDCSQSGSSPILFIRDNNPNGEYFYVFLAGGGNHWSGNGRQFVNGLNTAYNYYTFLTGEFKIPTFYLTLNDGRKLYLGKCQPEGYENNPMYRDYVNSDTSRAIYTEHPACAMWDYQAGTPLSEFFNKAGDSITLKNGTVISVISSSNNNNKVKISMVKTQQGGNIQKEWYVGKWFGNGAASYGPQGDLPNPLRNQTAAGMSGGGGHSIPCFMLNPLYNASVNDVLDENPEGDFSNFGPDYYEVIVPGNGTAERWTTETYTSWGFSNPVRVMWVEVATKANGDDTDTNFMTGYNGLTGWNFLTNTATTAEKWKILLGIEEGVEPVDPDHGSGSIGGGGKTGGGQGSFDDSSDTIGKGTLPDSVLSNCVINWYLGEAGTNNVSDNLTLLNNWLSKSVWTQGDITYKYDNKLQNICSLKCIYSPGLPTRGASAHIAVHGDFVSGNFDISSAMAGYPVTGNYTEFQINGGFTLQEYFGSFLDYTETKIQIYLPFAGVHDLNPSDIVGKEIQLWCRINFLTGDIAYDILENLGESISVIYTFTGNCSVDIPLTSKDYSDRTCGINALGGLFAGMVSGAVGGAATGNAVGVAAGALIGGIGGALGQLKTGKTITNGSFEGNSGAMLPMKPYLIVTRPKQIVADDYGSTYGWPSMQSKKLSALTGFVKVAECHWEGLGTATEEEIAEIDRIMKSGAIL